MNNLKRPSLLINAISNWASLIVNIAIGFVLIPFMINYLGKDGYGKWTIIVSFVGYYGIFTTGIISSIVRFLARYRGQGDDKSINEIISTAVLLFSCTGVLAISISLVIASPLANFFRRSLEDIKEFKLLIRILGLSTGLSFLSGLFSAIIVSHERYVVVNITGIITTLLRTCLTVLMLRRGMGLSGVAYASLLSTLFGITANYLICRYLFPKVLITFVKAKWSVLRMLLIYSASVMIITIGEIMRFSLDGFVIGKLINIQTVGVYSVAAAIIRYMKRIIVRGMGVLTPRFATLAGAHNRSELRDLFLKSLSISALLGCGVGMLTIIFGGRFIIFWVGKEFTDAIPVVWILATAYIVDLAQSPGIGLIYALNKHHYLGLATILEGIINLVVSIILAPKYGIVGVAMGTAIPMCIFKIFQSFYVARILEISIWDYVKRIIIPLIVGTILIFVMLKIGIVTSWDDFSIIISLSLVVVLMLVFTISVIAILKSRKILLAMFTKNS